MMGTYGRPCKECGARLDPGERCDCEKRVVPIKSHLHQQDGWPGMTEDRRKRELMAVTADRIIRPVSYL
jgi:hypothetical protein